MSTSGVTMAWTGNSNYTLDMQWQFSQVTAYVSSHMTLSGCSVAYTRSYEPIEIKYVREPEIVIKYIDRPVYQTKEVIKYVESPPIIKTIYQKEVIYMHWDIWNVLIVALIAVVAVKLMAHLSWLNLLRLICKGLVWPFKKAWKQVGKEEPKDE